VILPSICSAEEAVMMSFQYPEGSKKEGVRQLIRNGESYGYLKELTDFLEENPMICFVDAAEKLDFQNELKKSEQQRELLLQQKTRQLEKKSNDLDRANAALKVLLETRAMERIEIERDILLNLKQSVEPYLEKLKDTPLSDMQEHYVNLIETALKNVASPLLRSLETRNLSLTPTEVQVANLVKFGKSTKEISEITNVSLRTVESHKRNIRRKLGIKNHKATLRSCLLKRG
jgi:DNA-binding CsgD family transcriptional regulator